MAVTTDKSLLITPKAGAETSIKVGHEESGSPSQRTLNKPDRFVAFSSNQHA